MPSENKRGNDGRFLLIPAEERFWTKVQKTEGCWLWMATRLPAGYGVFAQTHDEPTEAHRFAYEQVKGPIPTGLVIDHLCKNPPCVNPDHLRAVTQRENLLNSNSLTTRNLAKTHCQEGHPYDFLNTYVFRRGRACRACHRAREIRRRQINRKTGGVTCHPMS